MLLFALTLLLTLPSNAVIGPIHIYNKQTEFRTSNAVVSSIGSKITLNNEQIVQTGANTFLELLATIPSVNLFNATGNVASVFLRGASSHNTVLIIDGVRVMDNSTPEGGPNLNAISLAQIEYIEVIKGPYSSLYGSNAIGGVIQVWTKKSDKTSGRLSTLYGSHNTNNSNAFVNLNSKKINISFGLNAYSTDGINVHKKDTDNDIDGKKKKAKNIAISYQVNDKLNFKVKVLTAETIANYDDVYGFGGFNHHKNIETKLVINDYQIDYQHSKNWQSKISLSKLSQKRQTFTEDKADSFFNDIKSDNFTWLSDIKLDEKTLLIVGYEKSQDKVLSITNDKKNLSNRDVFLQYQQKLSAEADIVVGYRETQHEKFGLHSIYNFGFNIKEGENFKFSGAIGTGFKVPVIAQFNDNPDLKPEESENIEFNVDYQSQFGQLFFGVYNSTIINDIEYKYSATNSDYSNSDKKITSKGVDISFKFKPIYKVNIVAYYYYNDAKKNDSDNQLNRRPKETAKFTIDRNFAKTNVHLELVKKGNYRDGTNDMKGYQLINLSANYPLNDDWKISFKSNNIANTEYEVAKDYLQEKATYYLGIHYNF